MLPPTWARKTRFIPPSSPLWIPKSLSMWGVEVGITLQLQPALQQEANADPSTASNNTVNAPPTMPAESWPAREKQRADEVQYAQLVKANVSVAPSGAALRV